MNFYSQVGQDQFLLENFFLGKRNGVFLDVGAYDGEKFSNSLFFERSMGWTGLCIEPLPSAFAKLVLTRKAICEQVCVGDYEGEADFVETDAGIDEKMLSGLSSSFDARHVQRLQAVSTRCTQLRVPVRKLSSLLAQHAMFHVDFCSLDTEGAELSILSELDLDRFHVSVFTIENNYDDVRISNVMIAKGYEFVAKLEQDYVFKRHDTKRLPRTSVICSVWHGDPNRWDLLRTHAANLATQTVPVQPIYVFDGGDRPPAGLEGLAVSVREPLTIYQAWNVALSIVDTPLVMNLNLDDRLAPDAVDQLQKALSREDAMCVGGDWSICYSQHTTDQVAPCYPVDLLPFLKEWPPTQGTSTRLGSGTGERGTLGPATLWRIEAHLRIPRYPWRLAEGSLLQLVSDTAWWRLLANTFHKKLLRLPMVIGNYHSHPAEQAEFRMKTGGQQELCLLDQLGVRLL
jgi:FkbM family methyltransferase